MSLPGWVTRERPWPSTTFDDKLVMALSIALEALGEYGEHANDCILSMWSAGEPTPDGGYRSMYAGKWYQTKPIDETPKCQCGLDEVFDRISNLGGPSR